MSALTDESILQGLCSFDSEVTREYFYGYCRRAYHIYDSRYQLHGKTGLDFYSLAHEYYIGLLTHEFKSLRDKPDNVRLSTWMTRGFHFVVLDALKAYNKEFELRGVEASEVVLQYVRSTDNEEGMLEQVVDAVATHYNDRKMTAVAQMILYAGFRQNEAAQELGMTPSAVNQRYKRMMEEVVTPFVIENYGSGLYLGDVLAKESMGMEMVESSSVSFPMEECVLCDEDRFEMFERTVRPSSRITPESILKLESNQVFVFGSNLQGIHAYGASRIANLHFGARMGVGVGMQGQSYAIPTLQGAVETIRPYVEEFIVFAKSHPELHFFVTPIGCGIAGFEPSDVAPLFEQAREMENVSLPADFLMII